MSYHDELMMAARRTMLKHVSVTDRLIRQLYKRAAKDIARQLESAKKGSLTERWLKAYLQELDQEIARMGGEIERAIVRGARAAAEARTEAEGTWLRAVADRAKVDDSFVSVLANVPTDALRAMYDGKLYTDGRMLSKRIWDETGRLEGNIAELIQQGVAQKMDALTLARQLEAYVNPEAACPVSWHKLYPDIPFERKIDYNALRLARTSISHVYWATDKAAARRNPMCRGLKWRLSDSHYERQVAVAGKDVCDAYAEHDEGLGKGVYPVERIPFPHPQCLCYRTEVLPSLEESAEMLGKFARGEAQSPEMEAYFKRWQEENREELENWTGGMIGETLDNIDKNGTMGIDSISIPHSLGAKSTNHRILLPDGSYTTFTDGTRITNIKIIAGNGRDRQIDEIENLLERFGGNAFEWQKKKGIAFIDFYGESIRAEVHWYEEPKVGRVKFKLKRLLEE